MVIDGTRRLLRSGQTSPEGVTLVSADSKEAVLEIDGEQKRYGLGGQIGGTYKKPDQVTVRIWPTPNSMYAVLGSINGDAVGIGCSLALALLKKILRSDAKRRRSSEQALRPAVEDVLAAATVLTAGPVPQPSRSARRSRRAADSGRG